MRLLVSWREGSRHGHTSGIGAGLSSSMVTSYNLKRCLGRGNREECIGEAQLPVAQGGNQGRQ